MTGSGLVFCSVGFLAKYECLHSIILGQLRHSVGIGVSFGRAFRYPNLCSHLISSSGFFSYGLSIIDFGGSISAFSVSASFSAVS